MTMFRRLARRLPFAPPFALLLCTLLLCTLLLPCAIFAQNPALVKDINAGSGSAFLAGDNTFVSRETIGNDLYIQALTPAGGAELWKCSPPYTDAVLVKDLSAGSPSGSVGKYLAAGGRLFFAGSNGASALCWSDGTAQGTAVLTNGKEGTFNTGSVSSQGKVFSHQQLMEASSRLRIRFYAYLYATNPSTGVCTYLKTLNHEILWKADVNGTLLFPVVTFLTNNTGSDMTLSLWKSNGTAKGTLKVVDLPMPLRGYPSTGASTRVYDELVTLYVVDGTTIYFVCGDASTGGMELWKSNGTAAGTMAVTDINPGSGNSMPTNAARMGGYLYFCANDGIHGYQVWRYPLAGGVAQRVTDIQGGTLGADPMWLTPLDGKLLFSAYTPDNGRELYVSNGLPYNDPAASTVLLEIAAGAASSNPNYFTGPNASVPWYVDSDEKHRLQMEALGGYLYFPADDGGGFALWRTDGVTTQKLGAANPRCLTALNGMLLFIADDGVNGKELWRFDPSVAPTPKRRAEPPSGLALSQNHPNPFAASTVVDYALPAGGPVTLRVVDMLGREVAVLDAGVRAAGRHAVTWNAAGLPAGMYCCRLEAGGAVLTRAMAVVR